MNDTKRALTEIILFLDANNEAAGYQKARDAASKVSAHLMAIEEAVNHHPKQDDFPRGRER